MMIQKRTQLGRAREPIIAAASKGSLVTARNRPNITAPATIMKTRQEIHNVSEMDLRNPSHEIFLLARQRIRAIAQLAAAASVAVTTPVKRAYIIIPKRTKMSTRSGSALIRSNHVLFGPFGPQSG